MKKFITLTSVTLLVLGMAVTTYAIDWGASGFLRTRSAWYVNANGVPDATADDYDDTEAWMDTRFRLKFTAKANDFASGVIFLEGDSTRWGEAPDGRNTMGAWNADRNAVEIKQVYIDFKIPGLSDVAPTSLRAGIQGLSYRAHILHFSDGAGVRADSKLGPVKLELDWFKPDEGNDHMSDDTDVYAVRAVFAEGLPIRPGLYVMYWNMNQYPMRSGSDEADFYWVGVQADGKIGPVSLKADFVYVDGDVERDGIPTFANPDLDYSGWCFYANVSVPLGPVTVGGVGMYATGNEADENNPLVGSADQDRDGFVVPPGSETRWIFTESIVFWPSAINDGVHINTAGFSGTAVTDGAVGGTWMLKGFASLKPLDWLKITGYAMYIGDTVDDGDVATGSANYTPGSDDDDIGIEFGAMCDISIYKNLKYRIGAGYLFAGDALETPDAGGFDQEPDDPWAVVSQLIFTF
jgi:hypothetical protein